MLSPPQIFHDKEDQPKNFLLIPTDLFEAINNTCTGNETKILLALLGCKGDGSFSPSANYIQKLTGIAKPNNYYKTRKQLEDKGYLTLDEKGNLYINTKEIINRYKKDIF